MDARRVLPFLLLVICTINAAFSMHNGWNRPNNIRRVRRISEYLVPPPPQRVHPLSRIPRLASYQSTNEPGYFMKLMNWIKDPFGFYSSETPPPPQLPLQQEIPYSSNTVQSTIYNIPPVDYQKPPPPSPTKTKNCHPCNTTPWMPIQQNKAGHLEDASHTLPSALIESSLSAEYPPRSPEIPHDVSYAASYAQHVRIPDFSFVQPGQDSFFKSPLPNPQLYPGAIPPIYKSVDFNSPQVIPHENSGYLDATSSSVSGNGAPIENDSPDVTGSAFNGGHNGQSAYSSLSSTNLDGSIYNGEFENTAHTNPIPDEEGFESTSKYLFGVVDNQPSEISNNEGVYGITGSSGSVDFFDGAGQTNPNFPTSYGISDPAQVSNNEDTRYNDLTSSANVVKGSVAPSRASDGSPGTIGNLINIEESPVIDLTDKGESRTQSSSIPSTTYSNTYVRFESTKDAETIVTPDDKSLGTRTYEGLTSTEPENYYKLIDMVANEMKDKLKHNNSMIQDVRNSSILQGGNTVDQIRHLLPEIFTIIKNSTTSRLFRDYEGHPDETTEESLNSAVNLLSGQQDGKRNKQIQVIIPYTSQYTPLPFQPSHETHISNTGESNRDSYVGEESRSSITVVEPPSSSVYPFAPTISTYEHHTRPVDTKENNSIDVNKLQKNIDNWTIQKYGKYFTSTTSSTVSSNQTQNIPYLSRSKTIPKAYFMSTEPTNHITNSYIDNTKILKTLAGFKYKGLANHRAEESQTQVTENLTEKSITTPIISEKDMWQKFPMGISSVNKERVYIVTPEPPTTPRSDHKFREHKLFLEKLKNTKESKEASQVNTKETKKSNRFESIEKAYQVLPQAVNNLAVASTGPESVPLWSIIGHDDYTASNNEYNNKNSESSVLYSDLTKESPDYIRR